MQEDKKKMQSRKELFRTLIEGCTVAVTPPPHNPDVLVKRECTHRECSKLSKCSKEQKCGGIDV